MIWDIQIDYPTTGETENVRNKIVDAIGAEAATGRSIPLDGVDFRMVLEITWRALVREDICKLPYAEWLDRDPVPGLTKVKIDPTPSTVGGDG